MATKCDEAGGKLLDISQQVTENEKGFRNRRETVFLFGSDLECPVSELLHSHSSVEKLSSNRQE